MQNHLLHSGCINFSEIKIIKIMNKSEIEMVFMDFIQHYAKDIKGILIYFNSFI